MQTRPEPRGGDKVISTWAHSSTTTINDDDGVAPDDDKSDYLERGPFHLSFSLRGKGPGESVRERVDPLSNRRES